MKTTKPSGPTARITAAAGHGYTTMLVRRDDEHHLGYLAAVDISKQSSRITS
ncbi:MAG: hypothetical protein H6661_07015 [Ardenticatenaceae bacterium]|nr:hypothetical protein [Ardenticatenaceae bacterium]